MELRQILNSLWMKSPYKFCEARDRISKHFGGCERLGLLVKMHWKRMWLELALVAALVWNGVGPCNAKSQPFCTSTLALPTCPDLPTIDTVNLTDYGGRWFEIGSSANFKNLQEPGGICIDATYGLISAASGEQGTVISVLNKKVDVKGPIATLSVIEISNAANQICQQARQICSQVGLNTSSLGKGLASVASVLPGVQAIYPAQAAILSNAVSQINNGIAEIEVLVDVLAKSVSLIQRKNSDLSQGKGNVSHLVKTLKKAAENASSQIKEMIILMNGINIARLKITSVADTVYGNGGPGIGFGITLASATFSINAGEQSILEELAEIQFSLLGAESTADYFNVDNISGSGHISIQGTAVQNVTFPGKLVVTFVPFPPGDYWILALEGEAESGYDASLVYGCDNESDGGAMQTLFILARNRTLSQDVIDKFFAVAESFGISQDCNSPFIYTVQHETCPV